MKNLIVVLLGGLSNERKISFLTGKACSSVLKKKGFKVINLDACGHFVSELKKLKPKIVLNALHGKYGEDGFVQSILESLKIKYTHSNVISSSLAMDKELSRILFKKNNLQVPKYILLQNDINSTLINKVKINKLKFPLIIKPNSEGSSLNVYIYNNIKELNNKYRKLSKNYEKILIEKYIPGREIQVAIMGKKKLGAIELVPKRKFYDYKAKYDIKSKTKHIIPVKIGKEKMNEVLSIALKAHKAIGCKGLTRSDFKFFNNKFYLLETNTQPGMTKLSLVPEIAAFCGIKFSDLIFWIAKDAGINR